MIGKAVRFTIVVTLVVIVVASFGSISTTRAQDAGAGLIVFLSNQTDNGSFQLFSVNPDGTSQRQITDVTGSVGYYKWSPDGYRVVFSTQNENDPNANEIYLIRVDGSDQHRLTDNLVEDSWPSWSPDSQWIAWTQKTGDGEFILIMDTNGDWQHTLLPPGTTLDGAMRFPQWSPDGSRIAFSVYTDEGGARTYTAMTDGSEIHQLGDQLEIVWGPSWSPDGTKIAFEARIADEQMAIFVSSPDGSGMYQWSEAMYLTLGVTWSPDGTKVAFTAYVQDIWYIYVATADGSQVTQLGADIGTMWAPAWSPDGRKIAFVDNTDSRLYIMNANGANPNPLTGEGYITATPTWRQVPGNTATIVGTWQVPDSDVTIEITDDTISFIVPGATYTGTYTLDVDLMEIVWEDGSIAEAYVVQLSADMMMLALSDGGVLDLTRVE